MFVERTGGNTKRGQGKKKNRKLSLKTGKGPMEDLKGKEKSRPK